MSVLSHTLGIDLDLNKITNSSNQDILDSGRQSTRVAPKIKVSNFSGHYLRNRSTFDIGVLGYIGIVQHKEHSPEVLSIPPGTLCIYTIYVCVCVCVCV